MGDLLRLALPSFPRKRGIQNGPSYPFIRQPFQVERKKLASIALKQICRPPFICAIIFPLPPNSAELPGLVKPVDRR